MKNKNNNSVGFTLIELLVVIAIVGLLASIILVTFNNQRTKATIAGAQQFAQQLDMIYGTDAGGMWNLDAATTTDYSTYNSPGVVGGVGAAWVTPGPASSTSTALSLTSTSLLDLGHATGLDSSTFTISMWIKINSLNAGDTNQNLIMSRGGWNTNGFRFGLVSSGSGFAFPQFWTSQSTPGGASGIGIESTKSVGSDRFYHLALTYNNGNASMYIDGHLSGSVTASQGVSPYYVIPVGSDLCLGGCMGGTTDSNSTYADVRYYSQSLLSDQIEKIYAESKTKYNE